MALIRQSSNTKKGEVVFRKKLYEQQVLQNVIHFEDEFNAPEIETIIFKRMQKTLEQMECLRKKGISLSPYVEIGAERGQRSLVMETELRCEGAAADISYYSLKSCEYYAERFQCKKMPLRICCDVNNLPFLSNSIPFVFCYETLHHFPDLNPVLNEVFRVLAPGGCFFFDEEPFRQHFYFPLYKLDKIYSKASMQRNRIATLFDRFFGIPSCNEIEHGITENFRISLQEWKNCLKIFDKNFVTVSSSNGSIFISTNLFENSSRATLLLCNLLGGEISGFCFKPGQKLTNSDNPAGPKDFLICPNCLNDKNRIETKITWSDDVMTCPRCSARFVNDSGVVMLLTADLLSELFPEFALKNR